MLNLSSFSEEFIFSEATEAHATSNNNNNIWSRFVYI